MFSAFSLVSYSFFYFFPLHCLSFSFFPAGFLQFHFLAIIRTIISFTKRVQKATRHTSSQPITACLCNVRLKLNFSISTSRNYNPYHLTEKSNINWWFFFMLTIIHWELSPFYISIFNSVDRLIELFFPIITSFHVLTCVFFYPFLLVLFLKSQFFVHYSDNNFDNLFSLKYNL